MANNNQHCVLGMKNHVCKSLTGSLPEDTLTGLAWGPWGVAYRQLALGSAAVVLPICVKYPAGTEFISGLDMPVLKKSEDFIPGRTFFCEHAIPTAPLPDAGETPLGIRIIFTTGFDIVRNDTCKM